MHWHWKKTRVKQKEASTAFQSITPAHMMTAEEQEPAVRAARQDKTQDKRETDQKEKQRESKK